MLRTYTCNECAIGGIFPSLVPEALEAQAIVNARAIGGNEQAPMAPNDEGASHLGEPPTPPWGPMWRERASTSKRHTLSVRPGENAEGSFGKPRAGPIRFYYSKTAHVPMRFTLRWLCRCEEVALPSKWRIGLIHIGHPP